MSRFFCDIPLQLAQQTTLPENVFQHWVKVLRASVGDHATLFNGLGGEYHAEITEITKTHARVKLLHFDPNDRVPKHHITIGQVMSKGDRMDYAVQKATELGVAVIQLLVSERCEMRLKYDRDQKKIAHWQNIAIAACEQCGMNRIPTVLAPLEVSDWVSQPPETTLKLVLALTQHTNPLPKVMPQQIALLIGAEGGLSEKEIAHAEQAGFQRWQLGERVLRTETAPVVAISIINSGE